MQVCLLPRSALTCPRWHPPSLYDNALNLSAWRGCGPDRLAELLPLPGRPVASLGDDGTSEAAVKRPSLSGGNQVIYGASCAVKRLRLPGVGEQNPPAGRGLNLTPAWQKKKPQLKEQLFPLWWCLE